MSGCAHKSPGEFCASCAPEKLMRVRDWLRQVAAALVAAMPPVTGATDQDHDDPLRLGMTIDELLTRIVVERDEARAERDSRPAHDQLLDWRGIAPDDACRKCDGSGHAKDYAPGARNQTLDDPGPCRACWGTGSISSAAGITAIIARERSKYADALAVLRAGYPAAVRDGAWTEATHAALARIRADLEVSRG